MRASLYAERIDLMFQVALGYEKKPSKKNQKRVKSETFIQFVPVVQRPVINGTTTYTSLARIF